MSKGKPIKQYQDTEKKAEYAYKFYVDKGYTPEQASGIVGNLRRESNFNTSIVGTADDKGSQGVAQWHSGRLDKLKSMYGDKWTDLGSQLEFIDWELNNTEKSAGKALKNAKTVWEAGQVFSDVYERPKVKFQQDKKRQQFVTSSYNTYGKMTLTDQDKQMFSNQQITTPLIDFEVPQISSNFVSVPDSPKEETKKEEKPSEALNQLKEQEFVKQYKSLLTQPQVAQQEQEVNQPIQTADLQGIFNQVSQFVDEPITAQNGGEIEESDLPNPVNGIVFKPEGGRTYYDDRLDRIVLTPQSDFAHRQTVINHEKFHKYQFDNGLSNFDIAQNTDESTWARMQKRPQLPTTDEVYYGFHDRKGRENQIDIDRVKQNETLGFVPDQIIYDRIVDRQQYENEYSLEGEATEYERSLYKQSGGKIIKDNNGYWNPNNWGKTVQIDGGDITMKGVNQILEGYSPETGERKLMFPNFDYKFSGAKRVIETPLKDNEIEFLKNIKK